MKKVTFSVNQLIIDDQAFDLSFFDSVPDKCKDPLIISKEVVSIKVFEKKVFDNRFVGLYFEEGEKYPYSPKVIETSSGKLEEIDNPKSIDEIELDDQFFALVDSRTQIIYASDQRRVAGLIEWISEKSDSNIVIKPLFEEKDFIDKIKSVSEISFTVVPNLFNQYDPQLLSAKIAEDIYGFGADEATLSLKFKKNGQIARIKNKIEGVMGRSADYEKLTIVGRINDNFESVFNINGIVNKVVASATLDINTKKINESELFDSLINKIKQNENTN